WGAAELLGKLRALKPVAAGTMVIVFAACMVVARYHLQFWENSFTLFERTLAVTTNNPITHYNLGLAYSMKGDLTQAKLHYAKALECKPGYVDAQNNLAATLLSEGSVD